MDAMEPAVRDAAGSLSPGTLVAWWRELARHRMMAGRAGATEAARRAFEIARGMDGPQLTMSTAAAWVRSQAAKVLGHPRVIAEESHVWHSDPPSARRPQSKATAKVVNGAPPKKS